MLSTGRWPGGFEGWGGRCRPSPGVYLVGPALLGQWVVTGVDLWGGAGCGRHGVQVSGPPAYTPVALRTSAGPEDARRAVAGVTHPERVGEWGPAQARCRPWGRCPWHSGTGPNSGWPGSVGGLISTLTPDECRCPPPGAIVRDPRTVGDLHRRENRSKCRDSRDTLWPKGTAGGTRTRNLRFGGPVRYPLRHDSNGTSAPPEGCGTCLVGGVTHRTPQMCPVHCIGGPGYPARLGDRTQDPVASRSVGPSHRFHIPVGKVCMTRGISRLTLLFCCTGSPSSQPSGSAEALPSETCERGSDTPRIWAVLPAHWPAGRVSGVPPRDPMLVTTAVHKSPPTPGPGPRPPAGCDQPLVTTAGASATGLPRQQPP